jgi:hypothetical protein
MSYLLWVIEEVMLFLQGHGVLTTYAVKIFKQYGEKAIGVKKHKVGQRHALLL